MRPHVIVLGNEKGGTGKSTIAMHIVVYLLSKGFNVGAIDVDARQGTFSRYFEHRKRASEEHNIAMPKYCSVFKSNAHDKDEADKEEKEQFLSTMNTLLDCQFIIIDTPGNDTNLSRIAHSYADTLVTPLSDSFIDLDVLMRVSNEGEKGLRPSIYAEMLWNQRKERAIRGAKPIDWIVVRNRLTTLYTRNRRDVNVILEALSKRLGFRLGAGFCERVVFKEMFLSGLTLLDIDGIKEDISLSHVSARQELRDLIKFMKLPNLNEEA